LEQLSFAAQGIEFYPGTSKLKPSSYKSLQRVCDVLVRCKDANLTINTYNDGGTSSQNVRLANLRACAIYSYFMKKKCISKARMSYDGFGDEDPNTPYTNATGAKSGSRTEFLLK
jgi:OOP family OmpA-OmpF porin